MAEEDIPERDPTEALLEDLIQCGWCSLGDGYISRIPTRQFRDAVWDKERRVMSDIQIEHYYRSKIANKVFVGNIANKIPNSINTLTGYVHINNNIHNIHRRLSEYSACVEETYTSHAKEVEKFYAEATLF